MRAICQRVHPRHIALLIALTIFLCCAYSRPGSGRGEPAVPKGANSMALTLTSTAFADGAAIPRPGGGPMTGTSRKLHRMVWTGGLAALLCTGLSLGAGAVRESRAAALGLIVRW